MLIVFAPLGDAPAGYDQPTMAEWPLIAGALLGVLIAAALRWAYFEIVAPTLLQLPMVAGIVLLALRVKKTLGHVERLADVSALALCRAVALYLLARIAFQLHNVGTLSRKRLIAAALLLALWPVAASVDALVALPLVAAVLAVLVGFEAVRFRETPARIRTAP
jgi:hypothetical protein